MAMTEEFKKGLATGLAIGGIKEGGGNRDGGLIILNQKINIITMRVKVISAEQVTSEKSSREV